MFDFSFTHAPPTQPAEASSSSSSSPPQDRSYPQQPPQPGRDPLRGNSNHNNNNNNNNSSSSSSSSSYNSAFVNLSTLTEMTTLDWWSQSRPSNHPPNPGSSHNGHSTTRDLRHPYNNNINSNSNTRNGNNNDTDRGDDDDKDSISSAELRRAIQAEASPSSTTAISVQPFDAVFPADGEHQVGYSTVGYSRVQWGQWWLLCYATM